jgi:sec-independent protein translocase protein TatA
VESSSDYFRTDTSLDRYFSVQGNRSGGIAARRRDAMFGLGGMELVIFAVIVLLLFGSRLPSVMRSMGASVMEFKKGIRDGEEGTDSTNSDPKNTDLTRKS